MSDPGPWAESLPDAGPLTPGEVHVWSASLTRFAEEAAGLHRLLSSDEEAHAARYKDPRAGDSYRTGRGILRTLLARYIDRAPSDIEITRGPHGKPGVAPCHGVVCQFNVAHSGDAALFAFTASARVGVDLERVRADIDLPALCANFLTPEEQAEVRVLPPDAQAEFFFTRWVRREAFLKASGEGFSGEPRRLDTALWTLRDLPDFAGCKVAVCVEGFCLTPCPPSLHSFLALREGGA